MGHVLLSSRWKSTRMRRGLLWCLSTSLLVVAPAPTMGQAPKSKPTVSGKSAESPAKSKPAAPEGAPAASAAPAADPSHTSKVAPTEVFKDPIAEKLLDQSTIRPVPGSNVSTAEILEVKQT